MSKLGIKSGTRVAVEVAEIGAKTGARMSAQTGAAASTGVGFPFVEAAFLLFDGLTLALDIYDMTDPNGFSNMGTMEAYDKLKVQADNKFKEELDKAGVYYPIIKGPLDEMMNSSAVNDTYSNLIEAQVKRLQDPEQNPEYYYEYNKFALALIEADADFGAVRDEKDYDACVNTKLVVEDAFKNICINKGGKILEKFPTSESSEGIDICTYNSDAGCQSSYKWPMDDNSEDIYAETKTIDDYHGKKTEACVVSPYSLRQACDEKGHEYGINSTHNCILTESYCKSKGTHWDPNKKDCVVPEGQDIAETLFGTVVVRSFAGVFDEDQYERCKDGEIDLGFYSCASCPEGQDISYDGAFCYPKCRNGYYGLGPTCWEKCGPNKIDTGVACQSGHTYAKHTYDRGVGTFPWVTCPDGYDKGTFSLGGDASYCQKVKWKDWWNPIPDISMKEAHTYCKGDSAHKIWELVPSKKEAGPPYNFYFGDDGNICLRDKNNKILKCTDTDPGGGGRKKDNTLNMPGPYKLVLQDDGNLVISTTNNNTVIWASNTNQNSGWYDFTPPDQSKYQSVTSSTGIIPTGVLQQDTMYYSKEQRYYLLLRSSDCRLVIYESGKFPGDKDTGLCYPRCREGYDKFLTSCWSKCGPDDLDIGPGCSIKTVAKDSYGRGAGKPAKHYVRHRYAPWKY